MKAVQSLAFFALMSLGLFPFFNHSSQALAVEPRKADRLKIGYASVTGNRISLWAAHQKGFFARHGLQACKSSASFPYTDVEDLRLNISDLAESNPKHRELNLANFVDNSFIQRVQQEGVK